MLHVIQPSSSNIGVHGSREHTVTLSIIVHMPTQSSFQTSDGAADLKACHRNEVLHRSYHGLFKPEGKDLIKENRFKDNLPLHPLDEAVSSSYIKQ